MIDYPSSKVVAKVKMEGPRKREVPKNFNLGLKYRKEGYWCQVVPFEVTGVRNYLWDLCKNCSRISARVIDCDVRCTCKKVTGVRKYLSRLLVSGLPLQIGS